MLDKRQDALEEQGDQLRKQEKMVETTQVRLKERLEDPLKRWKLSPIDLAAGGLLKETGRALTHRVWQT